MHASASPFLISAMLRIPVAMAWSPHRRSADQNALRHLPPQNRCGEPPRRARNGQDGAKGQIGANMNGRTVRAPLQDLAGIMECYRSEGLDDPFLGSLDLIEARRVICALLLRTIR